MRAKEFITEATDSILDDVAKALPMSFSIPKLPNSDTYMQYRFAVAIAKAKGKSHEDQDFSGETHWGHNQVVVGYSNTVDQYIDDALKEIGLSPKDKKLLTTPRSEESSSVGKTSPVARAKRNRYGV